MLKANGVQGFIILTGIEGGRGGAFRAMRIYGYSVIHRYSHYLYRGGRGFSDTLRSKQTANLVRLVAAEYND
jgi:hypothetical protein